MDRTSELERQQQALVNALFAGSHDSHNRAALEDMLQPAWRAGLKVYRANAHAHAQRALQSAYPVLRDMLGSESFDALACALWHQTPPRCGDLAQWGGDLPSFIENDPQLADAPYLADVARAEWALHEAALAADGQAEPQSFALLASMEPAALGLRIAPGTALIDSPWPIATLILAHRVQPIDLSEAARKMRAGIGEHVLVWRKGLRAQLRALAPTEAERMRAARGGGSLQALLDTVNSANADELTDWLSAGIREAWLLGLVPLNPHPAVDRFLLNAK